MKELSEKITISMSIRTIIIGKIYSFIFIIFISILLNGITIKMIETNPENKKLFTSENVVVDFKKKKKEKAEFKELAENEKQSDIIKVEQDFIAEIERGLEQEADIER